MTASMRASCRTPTPWPGRSRPSRGRCRPWLDNNLAGMLDMRHQGPIQSVMVYNVTKTVFVVMPAVWVAMMGWAGWHAQGLVAAGRGRAV